MKSFLTPFKVGLLILAAMAALVFMLGKMSQSALKDGKSYSVYAIIDDATGIKVQSRVMMAGIPIGEVTSVTLAGTQARIDLRIQENIELMEGKAGTASDGTPLHINGATMAKRSASLLGDYFIELSPGLTGRKLVDGDRIYNTISPVTTDDLIEQMHDLAGSLKRISSDVESITATMKDVFGDPETALQLNRILDDIEGTTSSLESIMKDNQAQLHSIVTNIDAVTQDIRGFTTRSAVSVDQILEDVQVVTSEMRHIMGESSADVQAGIGTLTGTMSSMQLALDNLNYSLANVQEITDRMVDGEGTIGALLTDDGVAVQAERALTSAADLLEPLSRVQTWVELRSDYNLKQSAFKNYFQLSIRPTPNKFYMVELIDDPRGDVQTELRTVVSTDPEHPGVRYEEVTTTSNRFQVSVQMGQRWQIVPNDMLYIGGRFGIIESAGGLGANIWAFKDAFEARFDLFDFSENPRPRLRAIGLLHGNAFFRRRSVLSNLFLQAGVDDVMNPRTRDFFIGAGLQFNDRDLRSIMSVAPSPSF